MELHSTERELSDGQTLVHIFDESGTLQGYVQGSGSTWKAYIGRPAEYLDTFDDKETALGILTDEILRGLPVRHVGIEPLIDRDVGQWSEVVFIVQVDLSSIEANREWDNILDKVSEVADKQEDKEVTTSLLEKIGIHFAWITADSV